MEILKSALAERYHTRFTLPLRIVHDVFKAQGIGGIGIFITVFLRDEMHVFAGEIGHQAEVALKGHAAVRTGESAAGSNPQRVRTMRLIFSVARVCQLEQLLLRGIIGPDIERRADGVGRKLVPEGFDAECCAGGVAEVGVR